ncbi:streptogrisin B [Allocatelliglobosispora scoriae]|uniref:Streptogrisin B n=1 Tax=Allocatelliglobosispora scoriae TaxID=643052 RepID=A0A841C455_9ACTN|nr:S1 family peptidase [Allocatelliglobosispora scoriae]MBB5873611.1 streptogrisin B [Allocatelliglobosispora scoriae]
MRRSLLAALAAAALLTAPAPAAQAAPAAPQSAQALLSSVHTPGIAWTVDPTTGITTVTLDDTVTAAQAASLRAGTQHAGVVIRREHGTLRTLLAGGDPVYGTSARCSLGANARKGTTYYMITAGHCTTTSATWWTNSARTIAIGTRTATSFPLNDYGAVRYTNTALTHPSAVNTYPGLLTINGVGTPYVGQTVCRSGATTGVRCGTITALNATVNYAEGTVSGLIRTNICAEPGDSGGPLYVPSTGLILGILSGGSGNCTSGGVTYYQPLAEILAALGLSIP